MTRHNFISLFFMGVWKKWRRVVAALGVIGSGQAARCPLRQPADRQVIVKHFFASKYDATVRICNAGCCCRCSTLCFIHVGQCQFWGIAVRNLLNSLLGAFFIKKKLQCTCLEIIDIYSLLIRLNTHFTKSGNEGKKIPIYNYQKSRFATVWKSANSIL